jgi:hypothetical protein
VGVYSLESHVTAIYWQLLVSCNVRFLERNMRCKIKALP